MDISTVKKDIVAKDIKDLYLFVGEEIEVMNIYINQIATVLGVDVKRVDTVAQVYNLCKRKSFFNTPYLYVVVDDKEFTKEPHVDTLEDVLGTNKCIIVTHTVDKRSKYYKDYKDRFVEFEKLKKDILVKYIRNTTPISQQRAEYLADICECDYGRCMLECDKINTYMKCESISADDSFNELLESGCINVPAYDAVFDVIKAVMLRDVKNVYYYLDNSKRVGESPLILLSVLYTQAKQVLQVQSYTGDNLAKATGLSGWEIKKAKELVNRYTNQELVYMMKMIRKCERDIKCGEIEQDMAFDYVLALCL